jgi:hypothetical protein
MTSTVSLPGEIIVDNLDPGFSTEGTWTTDSKSDMLQYGSNFVYKRAGDGTGRAIFTPGIQVAADYEVYVWWIKCWVCATNAPFTINYAGGSTTIAVNLNDRTKAGQWNSLGVYPFDEGALASIVLTDNADGRLIADAIRLVKK